MKIQITPRVTVENDIILDLLLEDNQRGTDVPVAGVTVPSFVTRTITTRLRLRDGESNLLAGLLQQNEQTSITGLTSASTPEPHQQGSLRPIDRSEGTARLGARRAGVVAPRLLDRPRSVASSDELAVEMAAGEGEQLEEAVLRAPASLRWIPRVVEAELMRADPVFGR